MVLRRTRTSKSYLSPDLLLAVALSRVLIADIVGGAGQVTVALVALGERVVAGHAVVAHAADYVLLATVDR